MKTNQIAEMIKNARLENNYTQLDLAKFFGFKTRQRIGQWENPRPNTNDFINEKNFLKIAALFNKNIDEWKEIYALEKIKLNDGEIYNKYIANTEAKQLNKKISDKMEHYQVPVIPLYTLPTKLKIFNIEVMNIENLNGAWVITCENRTAKDNECIIIFINGKTIFSHFNKILHNSNNVIVYPVINLKPII